MPSPAPHNSAATDAVEIPLADRPSLWYMFWLWVRLGAQSFGGGSTTLLLIRRAVVEERGWVSDDEFARDWAICQVAPGINLLAVTVLLGWRVAGGVGALLALLGLLLPSVSITIVLTACYARIRDLSLTQAALRGVIPATVGLSLLMDYRLAWPLLRAARRESLASLALSCALLAGGAVVMLLWSLPVVWVLLGGGLVGAVGFWALSSSRRNP